MLQNKPLFLALFSLVFVVPAFAEDGVFQDKIIFGQTAAIAGPAEKLGQGMQQGIQAAFKEVNDAGGVNGHKLELITLDDGYEPEKATANARTLIEEKKVFALIGGVGTPTSLAIQPIITEAKVPYIAPFTGAEALRNPYNRYTVNLRASYFQETEEMAKYLIDHLKYTKIAVLYQDDSFGQAGLKGIQQALERRHLSVVAQSTYKRNTVAVKSAVLEVREAEPEAIVMIGTYQPLAEFVKLCKELKMKTDFITLSFVGTEALASALGPQGKDVIVTQVVPYPFNNKEWPTVIAYHDALKKLDEKSEYGYVSLEGYVAGRFVIDKVKEMGDNITREAFLDLIYTDKPFAIGRLQLQFGPTDNQGMDQVYTTRLTGDGKIVPFEYPVAAKGK